MGSVAEQQALTPVEHEAPKTDAAGLVAVIERVAMSPDVDVAKLEKIIDLQERVIRYQARAAFEAAYAQMQPDLPEVTERGQIAVRGTVRSTYAKLEDIHAAVKPILARYGFALRHRTEWPEDKPNIIRVVGILAHREGHSEESVFEAPMDKSEYRTDIQSQGSTVSYGRRYTTLDLLNIATRGADDDGRTAGRPAPPNGFETWWDGMQDIAAEGIASLEGAWKKADADFKTYVVTHNRDGWNRLKERARTAAAS